jgi:ferritin
MTEEQIKQLEDCDLMLGRIASLVQEFCEEDETTLQGVAKLLALYRDLQAKDAWDFVDWLDRKNKI